MIRNLRRNLIIVLVLGAAIYLGMAVYADLGNIIATLSRFDWYLLPLALGLVCVNYLVRFIKWQYLLSVIGVRVSRGPSFIIFLSGLTMTISPAKMGEVLKSFMLKDHQGVPISRSSPVVVAERVTDVIGVVVLAGAGALSYGSGRSILAVTIVLMALFIGIVQTRSISLWLLQQAEHIPFVRRFAVHLEEFYERSYTLLRARHLLPTIALSTVGWFFECLAAWLCLKGLGMDISLLLTTFIFVIASLAGALAMIPGGLGVAEASMTGLLLANGAARGDAVAGTLLIRLVTFWFAIVIGIAGVTLYSILYGRKGCKQVGNEDMMA